MNDDTDYSLTPRDLGLQDQGGIEPHAFADMTLRQFVKKAGGLSREDFLARYPHPFLVQKTSLITPSYEDFHTSVGSSTGLTRDCLFNGPIHFVLKRSANFSMIITVGRTENNDICIPLRVVSKFHAYFARAGDIWTLTDSKSTNGTFAEDKQLAAMTPYALATNTSIGFSSTIQFNFLTAISMFNYLAYVADLMTTIGKQNQ